MTNRLSISHMGLALTACLLWSTAFVGVKIGLQYAKPLGFAGLRFVISGLLLLPFCGPPRKFIAFVKSHIRMILAISFLQTSLLYGLFYLGMTLIPGALGAIVIGSSPLFTAITAHFFMPDDEMSWSKSLSIGLGIVGIVIISLSRQPWSAGGLKPFLGIILLIGACISSAFGNIVVAREKRQIPPLSLNAIQILIGGLILLVISIPVEGLPHFSMDGTFLAVLAWLSILSAVAISIWFFLLRQPDIKVSELNMWKFVIPVSGAILSWMFLPNESPELVPVMGMICVTISVLFTYASRFRRRSTETTDGQLLP